MFRLRVLLRMSVPPSSRPLSASCPGRLFRTVVQAVSLYKTEVERWGGGKLIDESLISKACDIESSCEATAYESHIARSLRKTDEAQRSESLVKYSTLYAHVPESAVHALLWKAAKDCLAAKPASAPAAASGGKAAKAVKQEVKKEPKGSSPKKKQ